MSWDKAGFREKLEAEHTFPGLYIFKFIVPSHAVLRVEALEVNGEMSKRASSNGNYVSVTIRARIAHADEVIHVYEEASKIEGCIAL